MSREGAPELGIVIVSYNTRDLLGACLASVARELAREGLRARPAAGEGPSTEASAAEGAVGPSGGSSAEPVGPNGGAEAEVWVVDSGSDDGSAAMVAAEFPWVRLDAHGENVGFTRGNNRVLRGWASADEACPRVVLLLNPDAELTDGSLGRLMGTLREHPEAGAVGPALRYPDGRFQHAAFRFPGIVQTMLDLWPIARLADAPLNGRYPASRYAGKQPFQVDFVLGACLMMTESALRTVGPLDEGYVMYCEEIDWCRRAADLGLATLCEPRAVVIHHGGAATGQRRAVAMAHLWRSRLRWFALHASPTKASLLRAIVGAGLRSRERADEQAFRRGELSEDAWKALRGAYRAVRTAERL